MSSKPITLSDLNTALKPLIEAVARLREEHNTSSTQVSEMHNMLTNLSMKMDTLEQTAGATHIELSKQVVKKSSGRKPAAAKPAAKPVVKPSAKPSVKKAPIKKAPSKKAVDAEADAGGDAGGDDGEDDGEGDGAGDGDGEGDGDADADGDGDDHTLDDGSAPDATSDAESTASSTTKNASKKVPIKTTTVPTKPKKEPAAPAAKPDRYNKMSIFSELYKADPTQFDTYLTAKVKKAIADENSEKWAGATPARLASNKIAAYWQYMKTKHDDVMEKMKEEYIAARVK
jgi:hypothetical protein